MYPPPRQVGCFFHWQPFPKYQSLPHHHYLNTLYHKLDALDHLIYVLVAHLHRFVVSYNAVVVVVNGAYMNSVALAAYDDLLFEESVVNVLAVVAA